MSKTRFTKLVVLVCIGSLAGCSTGEGDTVGNTELNVVIPNGAQNNGLATPDGNNGSTAPAAFDIQSVEYTINCLGTPQTFLDENTPLPGDGAVQINGNLEVVDGRTSYASGAACVGGDNPGATCITPATSSLECQGTSPVPDGDCVTIADYGPTLNNQSEIWQGFMDLPIGECTVQLRARDQGGEVICTGQEGFNILADTTTKVNLILVCDISFQAPVGMLDLDATFSFVVGNFCPDLFVINCNPQDEPVQQIQTLAGIQAPAGCQVRFRDSDSTCGENCDPQFCPETAQGYADCFWDPDGNEVDDSAPNTSGNTGPDLTTTVTCVSDFPGQIPGIPACAMDCEVDGLPNADCTFTGNTLGAVGQQSPSFLNPGPGGFVVGFTLCSQDILDAGGIPGICDDPILIGEPLYSGATCTCTAVTTDGDEDCNKTKVVTLTGPGANFCDEASTDCSTDPAVTCTVGSCNRDTQACVETPVPAGGGSNCTSAPGGGLGQCDGAGNCADFGCTTDADCDNPLTACMVPPVGACNVGTGACLPEVPGNDGGACNSGTGSGVGACSAGSCVSSDACTVDADCGINADECLINVCNTGANPYACLNDQVNEGASCNGGTGVCDNTGACQTPPTITAGQSGTSVWQYETNPPGGVSGADPGGSNGGCLVEVTTLSTFIALDVTITLDASTPVANTIQTGYSITATNALLGALTSAAQYADLAIDNVVNDGTPGAFQNLANPAATGQFIGAFVSGSVLTLATPAEILSATSPTTAAIGATSVSVNFNGTFGLLLDVYGGGPPAGYLFSLLVDESICTLSSAGSDIVFTTTP